MICFLTTLRGNDGAERGYGERAGHRLHCWIKHALRDRVKDSIHLPGVWWMGNISDALAADPCLTPVCRVLLHTGYSTIECVLSHPPSLFGKPRRMVAQQSHHAAFQA
jgi:hypothetical protein